MRRRGIGQSKAARKPEKRTLRMIFWLTGFCSGNTRLLNFSKQNSPEYHPTIIVGARHGVCRGTP